MWDWHDGSGWGAGDWVVMVLMMVAFWGLLIVGVVALVRGLGRSGSTREEPQRATSTPERILGERFAKGEIDAGEYRDRLAALRGGPAHGD